jgi:Chemotaxis phosphatase CheX
MCSAKLSPQFSPEAGVALMNALVEVGEQSFFAFVERCDETWFEELASAADPWMIATVTFTGEQGTGSLSCTFTDDLVLDLFDAFTGRDPAEGTPDPREVADLAGEFANMVCGLWLSRVMGSHTFSLGSPRAGRVPNPAGVAPSGVERMLVVVNNRPMIVDLTVHAADRASEAIEV